MRIAEIYRSFQGEGLLTGTEAVFVRTSGCNLRCWFCDTPYTSWSPEGEDFSVDEVLKRVAAHDVPYVVITGGEPLLWRDLVPLTAELRQSGRHVTIETAGTRYEPVACDMMSISPKLASSTPPTETAGHWHTRHEATRHAPDVIRRLTSEYAYQLKFVIDQPGDCVEVQRWLKSFPQVDRRQVLLMPQGTTRDELAERAAWLEPYCHEHELTFCPRRHIEWFGLVRGR